MILKQRRSVVTRRCLCLCVSLLEPPPDHPGRRCTRGETHRRSYASLGQQDHNILTTVTGASTADHLGLSNLTIHPSVHLTKPQVEVTWFILFWSCCLITSCLMYLSSRQLIQSLSRNYWNFISFIFLVPLIHTQALQTASYIKKKKKISNSWVFGDRL